MFIKSTIDARDITFTVTQSPFWGSSIGVESMIVLCLWVRVPRLSCGTQNLFGFGAGKAGSSSVAFCPSPGHLLGRSFFEKTVYCHSQRRHCYASAYGRRRHDSSLSPLFLHRTGTGGGLREIGVFGEGLYIRIQFLQNFSSAKLAEVCTGVTQEQ